MYSENGSDNEEPTTDHASEQALPTPKPLVRLRVKSAIRCVAFELRPPPIHQMRVYLYALLSPGTCRWNTVAALRSLILSVLVKNLWNW